MDLTEAENINNRWQGYIEELHLLWRWFSWSKRLQWCDHHLEPDILECEVKWALGSITTNKVSGGEGIPLEPFQILFDDSVKVLHSIGQQIWETQQWPQDWKTSIFLPIPKKVDALNCSNYCTISFILHTSKVMLKILQDRLQQYMNHELPDVQSGFEKGRGTRDQIVNIYRIMDKARELQKKTSISALLTMLKPLTVWITTNWKILQEMGTLDHLTCLLRNLYTGQEATFRTIHGTTDWFQIRKGVRQVCILSPCLLNLYAEYIMRNAGLGWKKHTLESRLLGKISIISDMQMTPPLWQKVKRN